MYLELPHDKEQRLRVIRFFCLKLSKEDLAYEINKEMHRVGLDYEQTIKTVQEESRSQEQAIQKGFEDSTKGLRNKRVAIAGTAVIILILFGIGFLSLDKNQKLIAGLITAGLLLVAVIMIGVLSLNISLKSKKAKEAIAKIDEKQEKEMADCKILRDKKLSELSEVVNRLFSAWTNAIATEEEVFDYINSIMSKELKPKINELLDIKDNDIEDEHCAEIWTPVFLQSEILIPIVEIDMERSKYDIYLVRDEIILPLKQTFPSNLTWESFRDRILQKINLFDEKDLKLSSYNSMSYYQEKKAYLAGCYFYQKILCTQDFVSQFRCYVNILCNRIAFAQTLQILYEDISAIGIETSQSAEILYDSKAIDKHIQTLFLELQSGSTYKMSGDAGSNIGKGSNIFDFHTQVKSKANEVFEKQIRNVRAFILEAKKSNDI
jgi:hypothetical protein